MASLESVAVLESGPRNEVLHDVSFRVEPGQMVALVGPSGAGKTTISSLIPRLYDVTAGSLKLNGIDVRHATMQSIRDVVGVVTQDPYIFHDTLRANLMYARPEASEEEVLAALAHAQIGHLVSELPDGLDTVIGERGYRLSGGEKQRVALARLILKAPDVVVLDEATAHLDSESEAAVQRALRQTLSGRTSLVIAHRLSTVREADQLLVIDDGRVVERGTHAEPAGPARALFRALSHPVRRPGVGRAAVAGGLNCPYEARNSFSIPRQEVGSLGGAVGETVERVRLVEYPGQTPSSAIPDIVGGSGIVCYVMDLHEALYTTRAMRRVKPDPIPYDIQAKILDAAVRAPSGGNQQNWRFLLLDDPEKKAALAPLYQHAMGQLWETIYKPQLDAAHADPESPESKLFLRVQRSAQWLADNFAQVPLFLFPFAQHDPSGGSIFPAVWSAMLAARAPRGSAAASPPCCSSSTRPRPSRYSACRVTKVGTWQPPSVSAIRPGSGAWPNGIPATTWPIATRGVTMSDSQCLNHCGPPRRHETGAHSRARQRTSRRHGLG